MDMEKKSRSQIKREMQALQKIGEQLCILSDNQLKSIEMPEELRDAILFAKSLKKREARHRQMQYIGVLMRQIDPEPIQQALDLIAQGCAMSKHRFHQIEKWRDRFIEDSNEFIENFFKQFPDADRQRLRQLARNARKEREKEKPPKSSRALFRYLSEILDSSDSASSH